jgi:fucose 4-O-acetylase-like acetyltransferase
VAGIILICLIKSLKGMTCPVLEELGTKTLPIFICHAFVFFTLESLGVNAYIYNQDSIVLISIYVLICVMSCLIVFTRKPFIDLEKIVSKYIV